MTKHAGPRPVTQYGADQNRSPTCPPFPQYQAGTVSAVAAAEGLTVPDLVRQVLTAPGGRRTISIGFGMSEQDLVSNVRHPLMMIGSGGLPDLDGLPHPRLDGTFPRGVAGDVRQRGRV